MRPLALTRVRLSGSRRGTAAARVTPYALDETRQPSASGNSQVDSVRHRRRQPPDQERADRHRRADRPAAAVAEPVEERPEQRRHDRERQHRQAEEQRDLAARLAGRHLEEQRAGQRDRHRGVAGGVEGVHLDQPREPRPVGALGVRGAARLAQGEPAEAAGHPRGARDRRARCREPGARPVPSARPTFLACSRRCPAARDPGRARGGHVPILPARAPEARPADAAPDLTGGAPDG